MALLAPTILKEMRLSAKQYGFIISAFSIAYMISNPLWGRWLDRFGLRSVDLYLRILTELRVVDWKAVAFSTLPPMPATYIAPRSRPGVAVRAITAMS